CTWPGWRRSGATAVSSASGTWPGRWRQREPRFAIQPAIPKRSTAPAMMANVPHPLAGPGLKASIRSLPAEEGLGKSLDVAAVEERALHAVGEADGVALPGDPVGEDDLALGAGGDVGQVDDGPHLVAHVGEQLRTGLTGQRMGLPGAHGDHHALTTFTLSSPLTTSTAAPTHSVRSMSASSAGSSARA